MKPPEAAKAMSLPGAAIREQQHNYARIGRSSKPAAPGRSGRRQFEHPGIQWRDRFFLSVSNLLKQKPDRKTRAGFFAPPDPGAKKASSGGNKDRAGNAILGTDRT